MKDKNKLVRLARKKRRLRVRKRVTGTPDRPRLNVYRSLKHIYAQFIDDTTGRTLLFVSSLSTEVRDRLKDKQLKGKVEISRLVGKLIGEKALQNGIKQAVFDRNGYLYHGRVKAVADGAREAGLKF